MKEYQKNSIKSIYGKGTLDNLSTLNEKIIDEYYKYHHRINANGIEIPDKIYTINSYHGNSSYSYIADYNKENTIMDFKNYPEISLSKYKNFYKLLKAKDIDWDNAYLKYLGIQKNYDQPITYYVVDDNTGEVIDTPYFCYDYIFNNELCSNSYTINSTYELINIIDYLFTRFNALHFELNNVKGQRDAKKNAQDQLSTIEVDGE